MDNPRMYRAQFPEVTRKLGTNTLLSSVLPRSVLALCWAMAALHWRTGKKYGGVSYAGIRRLLGTQDRKQLYRVVRMAQEYGVVALIPSRDSQNRRCLEIRLTHATLAQLEELWTN